MNEDAETIPDILETADAHRERYEDLLEEAKAAFREDLEAQFGDDVTITISHEDGRLEASVWFTSATQDMSDQQPDSYNMRQKTSATFVYGELTPGSEDFQSVRQFVNTVQDDYDSGVPIEEVLSRAATLGIDREKVEREIQKLKKQGEVYEPSTGHLRTT